MGWKGTLEYALEFSRLPNQCGRCRSRDHQVHFCPRKKYPSRSKRQGHHSKTNTQQKWHHTTNTITTEHTSANKPRPNTIPHQRQYTRGDNQQGNIHLPFATEDKAEDDSPPTTEEPDCTVLDKTPTTPSTNTTTQTNSPGRECHTAAGCEPKVVAHIWGYH